MNSTRQYRCPNCKHNIQITSADFIKGIAIASCVECGRDAFAIEEAMFQNSSNEEEPCLFLRGGSGAK